MRATIIAVAALLAAGPAFAGTSLLPRVAKVDDYVKNVPPSLICIEPGNNASCAQMRGKFDTAGGQYITSDFPNGNHLSCFYPARPANYGLCFATLHDGTTKIMPVVNAPNRYLPTDDPRCKGWGSADTAEYIACEAAQP
jgi:hypothetical protein